LARRALQEKPTRLDLEILTEDLRLPGLFFLNVRRTTDEGFSSLAWDFSGEAE
jgi:hypothetical protein